MKKTTTILTIAILTILGFNTLFAQYSEGFENSFYPTGWNGKGFSKTNAKKKSGSYSAISAQNNANSNDNYMKIENVATSSSASISLSYIGHN